MGDQKNRKMPLTGQMYEKITDNFDNDKSWLDKFEKEDMLQDELKTFTLDNAIAFQSRLQIIFGAKLHGLKVFTETDNYFQEFSNTTYDNWTFPTPVEWNDYWYSKNRKMLAKTP